jgi:hypothetical protein
MKKIIYTAIALLGLTSMMAQEKTTTTTTDTHTENSAQPEVTPAKHRVTTTTQSTVVKHKPVVRKKVVTKKYRKVRTKPAVIETKVVVPAQ